MIVAYGPRRKWSLQHNAGSSARGTGGGAAPLRGWPAALQAVGGRIAAAATECQDRSRCDDQKHEMDPHYTPRCSSASPAASRRQFSAASTKLRSNVPVVSQAMGGLTTTLGMLNSA